MIARYACHGLGVVQPIDLLALDLEKAGFPFRIVGGACPPLEQNEIESLLTQQGDADFVWIGHSMGAALGFYLADKKRWRFRLMITVDPMDWASNIGCLNWQKYPPHPGQWNAGGHFDRWINIHSDMYPGGGRLINAGDHGVEEHHFPGADHIGIIAMPEVRKIIFDAVEAVK